MIIYFGSISFFKVDSLSSIILSDTSLKLKSFDDFKKYALSLAVLDEKYSTHDTAIVLAEGILDKNTGEMVIVGNWKKYNSSYLSR
jgi:hypothetical protein